MNDSDDNKTIMSEDSGLPTVVDGDESYCAACGGSFPMDLDTCPKDGARLTKLKAQPDELLGRVFDDRFEVRTQLGAGGMGTVYRGWQLTVDREIAIKVIHPKLASDRTAVKRFLREARLSSRLSQPNIVNVYDFGQTEDGILFIAMELLRGHTLGRELESMRPMAVRRVLTIGQQLCDALDSAHGIGIVHRDLKPNNIVILDDPPGRDLIKVLDFGLAKSLVSDTSSLVTNTNAILGTPLYMPPEQIEGKATDQRADLYSLGCILYQMLTGRPPFTGDNVNSVLAAHVSDPHEPLPASVPLSLARTVDRLMEKDPSKRMRSAREAREAMQALMEGGLSTSSPDFGDTTPDIRPSMLDTGPIELAVTDPAHLRVPKTSSVHDAQAAVSTTGDAAPRRTWLRWAAPLVVLALGGAAVGIYFVTREPEKTVAPRIEANPIATPDANVPAVVVDAVEEVAVVIDAVEVAVTPPDAKAGKKPRTTKTTPAGSATVPKGDGSAATVPKPVPPDASEPTLDFLKTKKPTN